MIKEDNKGDNKNLSKTMKLKIIKILVQIRDEIVVVIIVRMKKKKNETSRTM